MRFVSCTSKFDVTLLKDICALVQHCFNLLIHYNTDKIVVCEIFKESDICGILIQELIKGHYMYMYFKNCCLAIN